MIVCEDVSKSYELGDRRVPALRGFSMRIDEPGYYAIMGRSGSGKSTLLHLLASLDKPDSGVIRVAGQDLHTMTERAATAFRRTRIGIVFQQFNLIPTLTARENVELPGLLAGRGKAELRERSTQLLEELGLPDRAEHRPEAMSGGEQQRVAIARALLFEPPVVLADEPTGNLDSASSERLWALLAGIAKDRKLTVLMVTHEPAAAAHCGRMFVMSDGRLAGEVETEGLDAAGVASRYQECIRAA